jgi:periplasmic protein TonB
MAAKTAGRRKAPLFIGGLLGALMIAGFIWFVHTMLAAKTKKAERQVQVVQIIKPPPPPPDQPPPPPPEKTEEPLPQDEPEPAPTDEPVPQEQLGLDAEGAAGGDAFGLAARKGGSDLVGGSGNAAFAWYTNRLKDAVVERLTADSKIGSKKFSVSVRVWIESDGRVREVKLVSTTGNRELDQRIEAALASLTRLSDAPPLEMPQPVSLKIVSRI